MIRFALAGLVGLVFLHVSRPCLESRPHEYQAQSRSLEYKPDKGLTRVPVTVKVTHVYIERGVRRIAPSRMVWAVRKADLYDLAIRANWPKPYYPFMIQTRPPELTAQELKARNGFRRAGELDFPSAGLNVFEHC
jgi:hypothetical protein